MRLIAKTLTASISISAGQNFATDRARVPRHATRDQAKSVHLCRFLIRSSIGERWSSALSMDDGLNISILNRDVPALRSLIQPILSGHEDLRIGLPKALSHTQIEDSKTLAAVAKELVSACRAKAASPRAKGEFSVCVLTASSTRAAQLYVVLSRSGCELRTRPPELFSLERLRLVHLLSRSRSFRRSILFSHRCRRCSQDLRQPQED